MAVDIERLKSAADIVSVIGSYVSLRKRAGEYIGLCPFHPDKNPSFYVVPKKGIYHCFSCGASGDVIDFIANKDGLDFKAAAAKLGAQDTWTPTAPIVSEAKPLPERVTSKPPADAPPPAFHVRGLGDPSKTYTIRDLDGSLIGYECRYESEDKKQIRVWSWGARGNFAPAWGLGHLNAPRPLYGLERLTEKPAAVVLITEGPKKADAGARLLPDYASLSWTGGANAWHKHEWGVLAGRAVLIIPDADEPGITAGQKLAALLADPRGLACRVRIVDPAGQSEGWDIADWTGNTDELIAWAKPRAADFKVKANDDVPPLEAYESDPPPPPPTNPPAVASESEPPKPKRKRPQLAAVDGNTVRKLDPDAEPLPQAMSEDALADAFADQYGTDWRYVRTWGAWFEWDGEGWRRDETSKIDRLAVQLTRQSLYWPEAANLTAKERRMVNKRSTAGAVRDLAATDRRIAATVDQWDVDPWMMGVPGGVIDLKCGKLLPAEPENYITKRCAVAPDTGKPERWLEYLNRCHDGDEEVIAYLRRFAGYACTGETREHALAFLYGTGRNGKGVFLETISRILGDYAKTASINTFLEQRNPAHSTELARLHKARLVVTEEAGAGGKWNESRIKHMTGGGKITARFMRMDDFEFTPNFKLLVAANHRPSMRSVDEAMKARIHLVPFLITIPPEERDPHLLDKLQAEWPQILGWMLDGCAEWQERGLTPPQRIRDATEEYMQSEDLLGDWITERCEREGTADGASAFKDFRNWCEEQGHSEWSRNAWSRAMTDKGFTIKPTNGRKVVLDLSVKPSY